VVAVRESGLAKIWVADLRPQHLSAIAVDAELKRHQLQTTVLSVIDHGMAKQVGAMLQSVPGIEDFQMELSKQEAYVKFDRRRVTPEEIYALLATNSFAASPRDWEHR
jgi:GDP-D-mannose dehydratase